MTSIHISKLLRLRQIQASDSAQLFDLLETSRPSLSCRIPWVNTCQSLQSCRTLIDIYSSRLRHSSALTMGIFVDDSLAGMVNHESIEHQSSVAFIGYWIGDDYRHQGIGLKASRALITYSFENMNIQEIKITCSRDNYSARAIPESLQFILENKVGVAANQRKKAQTNNTYRITRQKWLTTIPSTDNEPTAIS